MIITPHHDYRYILLYCGKPGNKETMIILETCLIITIRLHIINRKLNIITIKTLKLQQASGLVVGSLTGCFTHLWKRCMRTSAKKKKKPEGNSFGLCLFLNCLMRKMKSPKHSLVRQSGEVTSCRCLGILWTVIDG